MNPVVLTVGQLARLRTELRRSRDVAVYRRAAALMALHHGESVQQAARLLGVSRQSIYNWVATYGAADEVANLQDATRPGRPRLPVGDLEHLLAGLLAGGEHSGGRTLGGWTARELCERLQSLGRPAVSPATLRRQLRRLGYVWRNGGYRPEAPAALSSPAPNLSKDL